MEPTDDLFDQRIICWGELEAAQGGRRNPAGTLAGKQLGFAGQVLAEVRVKSDATVGIVVFEEVQCLGGADAHSEFFEHLAGDAVFRRLTGLALAPGELPAATKRLPAKPLAD